MKLIISIFLSAVMLFAFEESNAQRQQKGFDYAGHQRMNKKAKRWGKHRVKAANYDQTNLRCSVRQSRRAARRAR